jgi:hypothetical protein
VEEDTRTIAGPHSADHLCATFIVNILLLKGICKPVGKSRRKSKFCKSDQYCLVKLWDNFVGKAVTMIIWLSLNVPVNHLQFTVM